MGCRNGSDDGGRVIRLPLLDFATVDVSPATGRLDGVASLGAGGGSGRSRVISITRTTVNSPSNAAPSNGRPPRHVQESIIPGQARFSLVRCSLSRPMAIMRRLSMARRTGFPQAWTRRSKKTNLLSDSSRSTRGRSLSSHRENGIVPILFGTRIASQIFSKLG